MKRILLLLLLCGAFRSYSQQNDKSKKPNYILIVADDLGYGDLGFTGSQQIKTPNIDHLAKTGAQFTQGYVTSAVCSPSRASFLTGINQVEFGYDNNLGGSQPGFDPEFLGLPVDQKTIANYLFDQGYVNGIIGKWHLGYEDQFYPLNRGFHEFWGYRGGGHDYFTALPDGKGYRAPIESNFKTPQPLTYITDDKGDECIDFIKRHKNEPFFIYASFNAPHSPMQATEEDLELYKHIKDKKSRTYAAMVHRLDINIGRIVTELERQGLRENTLIVFFSDNGGPVDVNSSINAPYRGQKGILLEGGIHVPFILNWPGVIPAETVIIEPVISLDVAPTFIELAGGDVQQFEGKNLITVIKNEGNGLSGRQLRWRFTISAAIRQGNWKLIRLPDRLPMLYNLEDDPSEENDLGLVHLEKTRDLLNKLGTWDVNLPHPLFLEAALWKKRQISLYDVKYPLKQPENE